MFIVQCTIKLEGTLNSENSRYFLERVKSLLTLVVIKIPHPDILQLTVPRPRATENNQVLILEMEV